MLVCNLLFQLFESLSQLRAPSWLFYLKEKDFWSEKLWKSPATLGGSFPGFEEIKIREFPLELTKGETFTNIICTYIYLHIPTIYYVLCIGKFYLEVCWELEKVLLLSRESIFTRSQQSRNTVIISPSFLHSVQVEE